MDTAAFGHGWGRAEGDYYVPRDTLAPQAGFETTTTQSAMARWDQEDARRSLRQQVLDHLATPEGVLVLDEAEFVKDSSAYVGAQRYTDEDGRRAEHRQTGVFLAYSGPRGEGYLDRELFLPRCWTEQESLRLASGLPAHVTYTTRPQMARVMLERALEAGVPHRCIAGGPTFGADAGLRLWLEQLGETYILGVPGRHVLRVKNTTLRADALVGVWPRDAWRAAPRSQMALDGDECAGVQVHCGAGGQWERWLLARRLTWDSSSVEYFLAFTRAGETLEQMVSCLDSCRRVTRGMREARRTVGLDRFTGKSWEGWYRHMTVALMAHAMLGMVHRGRGSLGGGRRNSHLDGTRWDVH